MGCSVFVFVIQDTHEAALTRNTGIAHRQNYNQPTCRTSALATLLLENPILLTNHSCANFYIIYWKRWDTASFALSDNHAAEILNISYDHADAVPQVIYGREKCTIIQSCGEKFKHFAVIKKIYTRINKISQTCHCEIKNIPIRNHQELINKKFPNTNAKKSQKYFVTKPFQNCQQAILNFAI